MGKEGRTLKKRRSTSTDVEPTNDHKPLQKAERELQTDVNPKKPKRKQIDEDDLKPPKKRKKGRRSKKKECCFKTEDAEGNNPNALLVRGLDTSLSRELLKSALRKHFESCGCEVTRVFVPIECKTRVPLGFAFIDVDDEKIALELGMEGCRPFVNVMKAFGEVENVSFPGLKGCKQCSIHL